MFTQLFSLLPLLAALPAANAYFILGHPVLETTRLDPIVNPGAIGAHVHSIVGGNNFDKDMTYESTQQSTCTTAPVSVDKSNYWIPQLYYYNPSGKNYQAIPVSYVNTYYLPRYSPGEKTVRAFPDGLRMVSGDATRRTYDGDAESNAISYVCLDYYNNHSGDPAWAQRNSFFSHNCPQGMRAQVFFRSCWDGVNLDSDDHMSHMAWPSGGVDGGSCPSTHPIRLASLFYEFIYQVQNFPFNNGSDPTWVWANGDTTGYGLHGDFLNGWPSLVNGTNVLQRALNECNDNNGVGGELSNCPPFVPYLDSYSANACMPKNLQVNEDVGFGHYISKIPGDNPIWIGDVEKPSYGANYTDDDLTYTDFKSVIPDGYTDVGCIAEGTSGRALSAASFSNDNMTRSACVSWCQDRGYPLAGIEYGRECYCDFAMRNGASNTTLLPANKCGKTCANNANENCGGSSTLELFNNPSLYTVTKLPTGWSSNGCVTEGSGSRALTGYSFASSSMTQELCMTTCQSKGFSISGIEYSSECYCGNAFTAGANPATDNCNMVCSGNNRQTCGGPSRLTTFKYSNATVAAPSSSSSAKASSTSASASASASSSSSVVVSSSASKAVSTISYSSSVARSSSSSSARSSSSASSSSRPSSTSSVAKITSSSSSSVAKPTSSSAAKSSTSSSIVKSSTASSAGKSSTTSSVIKSSTISSAAKSSSSSAAKPSSSSSVPKSSNAPTPVAKFASPLKASSSVASSSTSSAAASSSSSSAAASSSSSSAAKSSASSAAASSSSSAAASSSSSAAASSSSSSSAAKSSSSSAAASSSSSAAASSSSSSSAAKSSTSSAAASSSSSAAASSSSSAAKSSTSSLVPSSTSSSAAPSATVSAGAYMAYVGCFKDTSGGRHLNGSTLAGSQMNNEVCTSYCQSKGYAYAGTEYSQECYCGNQLNLALAAAESKCNTQCRQPNPTTGAKEICGGGMILSVYTTGNNTNAKPYGVKPANPNRRSAKFRV